METINQFGLEGVAVPGPDAFGRPGVGQGVVPGWGLEVEG